MSQEKVDKYKQEKANRKQNMKKEKVKQAFRRVVVGVLGIALVGWLGYSAWDIYETKQNSGPVTADITALNDYTAGLSAE